MAYILHWLFCLCILFAQTDIFEDINKDIRKGKTEESEVSLLFLHYDDYFFTDKRWIKTDQYHHGLIDQSLSMDQTYNIINWQALFT